MQKGVFIKANKGSLQGSTAVVPISLGSDSYTPENILLIVQEVRRLRLKRCYLLIPNGTLYLHTLRIQNSTVPSGELEKKAEEDGQLLLKNYLQSSILGENVEVIFWSDITSLDNYRTCILENNKKIDTINEYNTSVNGMAKEYIARLSRQNHTIQDSALIEANQYVREEFAGLAALALKKNVNYLLYLGKQPQAFYYLQQNFLRLQPSSHQLLTWVPLEIRSVSNSLNLSLFRSTSSLDPEKLRTQISDLGKQIENSSSENSSVDMLTLMLLKLQQEKMEEQLEKFKLEIQNETLKNKIDMFKCSLFSSVAVVLVFYAIFLVMENFNKNNLQPISLNF